MRILLIDNYDSFTWNLHHLLEAHAAVEVVRNDAISVEVAARYDRIVLSPGPGLPGEAGHMMDVLDRLMPTHSILGVCLGMQGIAEACGGLLFNLPDVRHGVEVGCRPADDPLFAGIDIPFRVGLYHSWAVDPATLPAALRVAAWSDEGIIMALRHVAYDVCGLQFHPESVLTPAGARIISNWIGNGR